MNKAEIQLFNNCRQLLEDNVDPVTVSDGLFQRHFLSANQRKSIYDISRSHVDRSTVWNSLYTLIPSKCDLQHLLMVLLDAGYTEIALVIGQKLRVLECRPSDICRIYRTKTGDASQRFAQKLFMNFKINTHNNAFVNPRQYCHEESQKYKIQLERYSGADEDVKRGIADKYVACLLAEIDSHIMLYTRQFPAYQLIKQLKQTIPETSNSNITELSYESRVAMACALSGKEIEGEEHLQRALGMSLLVGRCVEISNLLYIYVFNLLSLYEKFPTKRLRDKIIHIAEMGIQSVEDETDSIREFWFRIFILRIIYCLLGLSYRGDPIYGIVIDKLSIMKAKQLLTEVDRQWKGMETRRKIMYYVAKARIVELEQPRGYTDTVLYFLNMAIDIGNDGEYGETQFVKRYASYFQPYQNSEAQMFVSYEGTPQDCFESNETISSPYDDDTTYSDIMNNLQLIADNTSDTKLYDHSETSFKLIYTDDDRQKVAFSKFKHIQNIPLQLQNVSGTEMCGSSHITVADKILTTPSHQTLYATKTREVETFGTLRIYDNALMSDATNTHEETVLKALNINRIKLPHENESILLTEHTKSDDTFPKRIPGNDMNSTLADENTVPKWSTDSTEIKKLFPEMSEQNSSAEVNCVPKSNTVDTESKTICNENTVEKSLMPSVSEFENTKVKDVSDSGIFRIKNNNDYDQTSTKISKPADANTCSPDNDTTIHYNNTAVLDEESLPFYDVHKCDKD